VKHLVATMTKFKVPEKEQKEVAAAISGLKLRRAFSVAIVPQSTASSHIWNIQEALMFNYGGGEGCEFLQHF